MLPFLVAKISQKWEERDLMHHWQCWISILPWTKLSILKVHFEWDTIGIPNKCCSPIVDLQFLVHLYIYTSNHSVGHSNLNLFIHKQGETVLFVIKMVFKCCREHFFIPTPNLRTIVARIASARQ